jgi:hypothetical protein
MSDDATIKAAAEVLRAASDYRITGEYYAKELAKAGLLAAPGLQKRVDCALALCDAIDRVAALAKHRDVAAEIRAALTGGQPTDIHQ